MNRLLRVLLIILAVIFLALPWCVGQYTLQVFIITITYAMLGLSFVLSMRVGLPRFDIAAWWGIGAYTTAMLTTKVGVSFWATIPAACAITLILGWLVFRVAVPRGMMVFLMFGMVLSLAVTQALGSIDWFGGWGGTQAMKPPSVGSWALDGKRELYYLGLTFLVFNLVCLRGLYRSRIGRAWAAIGQSVRLAHSVGIDVVKYRMANVLIGNVFLALCGSFYMAHSLVAVPTVFSLTNSFNVMMYAVIGGIGFSLAGPLVGALVLAFVPEYLRIAKEYEPIIMAAVIILIIAFMSDGLLGCIERLARRLLRTRGPRYLRAWAAGCSTGARDGQMREPN